MNKRIVSLRYEAQKYECINAIDTRDSHWNAFYDLCFQDFAIYSYCHVKTSNDLI